MKPRSPKQKAFLEQLKKDNKKREAEIRKNYPDEISCAGCGIDNEYKMHRKYATTSTFVSIVAVKRKDRTSLCQDLTPA